MGTGLGAGLGRAKPNEHEIGEVWTTAWTAVYDLGHGRRGRGPRGARHGSPSATAPVW